jgi:hypothetical protein
VATLGRCDLRFVPIIVKLAHFDVGFTDATVMSTSKRLISFKILINVSNAIDSMNR